MLFRVLTCDFSTFTRKARCFVISGVPNIFFQTFSFRLGIVFSIFLLPFFLHFFVWKRMLVFDFLLMMWCFWTNALVFARLYFCRMTFCFYTDFLHNLLCFCPEVWHVFFWILSTYLVLCYISWLWSFSYYKTFNSFLLSQRRQFNWRNEIIAKRVTKIHIRF